MTPPPFELMVTPELIRAAQAGDAQAMSQILDGLSPWVGRICGSIAFESGADAAQDALIQVFRDLKTLREPAALRGWVRRIATREAVRHAQRERKAVAFVRDVGRSSEIPKPNDPTLITDIRTVLESLSPEQRAILVLRDLEGLSEDEAAQVLEVAKGTAKSRLHRARAAFLERWLS
jgi:RNA polymerase sigma factor (sigma-70 family)